ncbi:MAG TPA: hypothetical protein VH437_17485 [Terriglobales bacterium]
MPPSRRIDDRIRELCGRIVSANDSESETLVSELRVALSEYTRRVDKTSAVVLSWPEFPRDRRKG